MRKLALRWFVAGTAVFWCFSLTGCLATLLPETKRFAVAPGYILQPTLTAVASVLPLGEDETELIGQDEDDPVIVDPNFSLGGFLRDKYALQRTGIYFTAPYDPDKIPILFVHGLVSDPYTWRKLTKSLTADPEIAERYQFWYYAYSTSVPAMAASATLRGHLDELDRKLREEGKPALNRKLVVCGHSLGGVMSKSIISSSGDDLWDAAFNRPVRDLKLDPDQKELLEEMFFFEAHPAVSRAIIMAAPIRGTLMARTPLASVGRLLSNEPDFIGQLMDDLLMKNADSLRPDFAAAIGKRFDSISSLDPNDPLTPVFAATSIDPGVPFHSIAGISRFRKNKRTDGWVPLESTVLKGAVSRVEVESNHHVHEKKITAEIVKLILRHHSGLITEKQLIDGVAILGAVSSSEHSRY